MSDDTPRRWWEILPSILMALATVIMTVTGLLALFRDNISVPPPAHESSWIGLRLRAATAEDIDPPIGAVVTNVVNGGPAEDAGIKSGDIIIGFDGKRVEDHVALQDIIRKTEVGELVKVEIVARDDKVHLLWLKVGKK